MGINQLKHVAIIMDGNGRWAVERGKPRAYGHLQGALKTLEIVEHLMKCGLRTVTLWGFSTENWKRPKHEVNTLMNLFQKFAVRQAHKLDAAEIKVSFIGRRSAFPQQLQRVMHGLEEKTKHNTKMHLRLALNYSSIQETVDAANALRVRGEAITDEALQKEILGDVPPYDAVIRTSGEYRVSGFPIGYAELFVVQVHWPACTTADIDDVLCSYQSRTRRFGGVASIAT